MGLRAWNIPREMATSEGVASLSAGELRMEENSGEDVL